MIKVRGLTKSLGGNIILNQLDLDVQSGEIFAVMGSSGAGKSVFLKHLIGLFRPDSGTIEIDNQNITRLKEKELLKLRKDMGYLFQEGALYDFMTVFDNVAFPLREHTRLNYDAVAGRVHDVLKMVDLENVEKKFPAELSGGMKKRVGLARAIIMGAKILFCDEPTSGLDPIRSRDISDLIRQIAKKINSTTVITSHDIENVFRIADRMAILEEGKILALGTKDELLKSTNAFVQEFLLKHIHNGMGCFWAGASFA